MSLREPKIKMSKSQENQRSRILITDDPDLIREKVKHALTDSIEGVSYDPIARPGVSNLVDILRHLRHEDQTSESVAADCCSISLRAFKDIVADAIISELASVRVRYNELNSSKAMNLLGKMSEEGSRKARNNAERTLTAVRHAIGL